MRETNIDSKGDLANEPSRELDRRRRAQKLVSVRDDQAKYLNAIVPQFSVAVRIALEQVSPELG
jgi:hypothetical protein